MDIEKLAHSDLYSWVSTASSGERPKNGTIYLQNITTTILPLSNNIAVQ
ncbi:hypothetical protein PROVALCAL_01770 [Providencia alcalifaciens DSM 30120]|uniref:Uncharacterized protein n=1 Tax=Providencia alcalifaciens DSM 30120 TaxID=520999 RepID=B6XEJ1_9GAMM|nr:hypothetical protein PROVALCAL_01770 [Providencia alcalifaciens DSM 30120]